MVFLSFFLALTMALPGYDFLTVPRSPRDPGAADIGIDAFFLNPASLAFSPCGIFVYQNFWFIDSRMTYIGASISGWGARITYFDFGKFEYQDEVPKDEVGPFFHPYAIEMAVDRGFLLDPELSAGLGIAFFYQKIQMYEAHNLTLEGGVRYAPKKLPFLSFGLSFRYLGFKSGFREEDFKMPTQGLFSINFSQRGLKVSYNAERIFTYETEGDTFTGTLSSVRNSLKEIIWILDPTPRLGTTHRWRVSYSFPYGMSVYGSYSYLHDVTPLTLGLSYQAGSFTITYAYRIARRGFDAPHQIGLEATF